MRGAKKRVLAVRLSDDKDDSSRVFDEALQLLRQELYEVRVVTVRSSGLYLIEQTVLFIRILLMTRRRDIIYLHSLKPFGAALAGKLRGGRIIYYIHDAAVRHGVLKRLLVGIMNATARQCIFVSHHCREQVSVRVSSKILYQTLPLSFTEGVLPSIHPSGKLFTVLMICPTDIHRGVKQFVECATALPGYRFELVLDTSNTGIHRFFAGMQLPPNLYLYEAQKDIHPFYTRASVVLDLSMPDQCIDKGWMTVLKAMYYGRPVIVPSEGSMTELVEDGSEGFYVDSGQIEDLVTAICLLSEKDDVYQQMSRAAYRKARCFGKAAFDRGLLDIFQSVR